MIEQAYRDKFWAYVTVFGTLWGGLELTLGTFLHVLHVPKTGLIMVTLSLILIIAQRRIFPARGSTLCTGVIAACIKSLSPGGIIAGPIFGIMSEALFVELCLLIGSRSVIPYMCAGAAALLWSQLQSLFKLWIYYGQDFIASITKVIEKFFKIEWTAAIGWSLLGIFFGLIIAIGCTAGFIGWRLGRRVQDDISAAVKEMPAPELPENLPDTASENIQLPEHRKKSGHCGIDNEAIAKTRLYVAPFAVVTLFLQFSGSLLCSSAAIAVWFAVLAVGARGVLRAIWWPKFWGITIAVSAVCGVIIAWNLEGAWHWMLGIEATARMIIRGLYVFSFISWLTRCVRSKEFLTIWNKIHLPELGLALTRAYALLPAWSDRLHEIVKNRPEGIAGTLRYTRENILSCLVEATLQTETIQNKQHSDQTSGEAA